MGETKNFGGVGGCGGSGGGGGEGGLLDDENMARSDNSNIFK